MKVLNSNSFLEFNEIEERQREQIQICPIYINCIFFYWYEWASPPTKYFNRYKKKLDPRLRIKC
jgi:hypothetical protein